MAFNRVKRDLEFQDPPDVLLDRQLICKNKNPVGQSVFELLIDNTTSFYGQLPSRYHKKIMFGRGDYCICTFPENYLDMKPSDVMGTIDMLLTKDNIALLKDQERFPECFLQQGDDIDSEEPLNILDFESSLDYY